MEVKGFSVGQIMTNCYFVGDENTKKGCIIDPGDEGERLGREWASFGYELDAILLTHGHFDHVSALAYFVRNFPGLPIYVSEKDVCAEGSDKPEFWQCGRESGMRFIHEGETIAVGSMIFQVLETPGHTPGSVIFKSGGMLFTGDTLFAGSCGRTDFPGGDWRAMLASLKRLYELPGEFKVYPGHEWTTTLGDERRTNCFMRQALDEA